MTTNANADRLGEIEIFSELSKRDLRAVGKLMTGLDVKAGRVLTRQGEPGREFLIISEGTATVEIDGVVVAHLGPGDFLGELAVITGTPRSATVVATSPMIVQVLNRREFMALLDQNPTISRKILVGAMKRLQVNERTRTN